MDAKILLPGVIIVIAIVMLMGSAATDNEMIISLGKPSGCNYDGRCQGWENPTCPDCAGVTTTVPTETKPECNDKIDNDGDGLTDFPKDSGCSGPTDDDETNCGDGVCEGGETYSSCPEDCEAPTTTTIQVLCTDIGGFCTVNSVCLKNDGICYDGYPDCGQDYCCCVISGETTTTVPLNVTTTTQPPTTTTTPITTTTTTTPITTTIPDSCSDTDGGIVSTVKGTVSGYYNQQPYSYTDYCLYANETGQMVLEYYCSGNIYFSTILDCEAGIETTSCVDGACV